MRTHIIIKNILPHYLLGSPKNYSQMDLNQSMPMSLKIKNYKVAHATSSLRIRVEEFLVVHYMLSPIKKKFIQAYTQLCQSKQHVQQIIVQLHLLIIKKYFQSKYSIRDTTFIYSLCFATGGGGGIEGNCLAPKNGRQAITKR